MASGTLKAHVQKLPKHIYMLLQSQKANKKKSSTLGRKCEKESVRIEVNQRILDPFRLETTVKIESNR